MRTDRATARHPDQRQRDAAGRATLRTGITLLVVAALLAGCGGDGGAGAGDGGTAVVGTRNDFSGFNPVTNSSLYTDEVMKFALYTPLIQYDEALRPVPYLAESWELEGDTGVVFTLRRDVRWHDGRPVTAEDVHFTFELAKAPEAASPLMGGVYLAQVATAEVVDSFTIRFGFTQPHAQALEDFWWPPLPKHLLDGVAPAELRNAPFNRDPVGSGPFRFREWRPNDRLVLERNPDFPEALGGPPALARVVFRVVPEPATLLTELLTGGVHVDIPVEPDQTAQIEEARDLTLYAYPGRTLFYIGWNNERAPFTDARVRRAMTHAIDRREIIAAMLEGHGAIATSTVPPWHPFHVDEMEPLAYDPDRARALLDEAGWRLDGDVRTRNGIPLRFTLLTSERQLNRAIVEVVQSQLRAVGARAEIQVLEFQTMLAQHRAREFDAVLSNWVLDNFQMAGAPAALFHSRWAEVPGSSNRSGVRSARLDSLIDAAASATDPLVAEAVFADLARALRDEQPYTFMFWLDELAAAGDALENVRMDQRGELLTIREWRMR